MQIYNPKQIELLALWRSGRLKRINILSGSVRSGKTWVSLVLWGLWVWSMPPDRSYLMAAKTLTSLRRNCLDLLQSLVGTNNFTYSLQRKEASLFGRRVYLEGANDARSESKIRGMTLAGAYVDELTQIQEDFFTMLLSRLSEPGAKLISTTNPDGPLHWVKTDYLDRVNELDLLMMKFLITDNEFLDPVYVENITKEYTGVFYSRYILGEWVRADGLIYPMFNPDNITKGGHTFTDSQAPTRGEYIISVDYGTSNPTSVGLWRVTKGIGYCLREYYHNGRKDGQLTDEKHMKNIIEMANSIPDCKYPWVYIDPSAASLKACFNEYGWTNIYDADNSVIDGIRNVGSALQNKRILFHENCTNTIKEFQGYVWDDKSSKEQPLQENDHCMDFVRYFVRSYLKQYYHDFI